MSSGPATVYLVWQYAPPPLASTLLAIYGDERLAVARAAREASAGRAIRWQWALVGEAPAGPMMMPDVDG